MAQKLWDILYEGLEALDGKVQADGLSMFPQGSLFLKDASKDKIGKPLSQQPIKKC